MDEIIICDYCGGTGYVRYDIGTHHSEYETAVCTKCNGSGRLINTIINNNGIRKVVMKINNNRPNRLIMYF